MPDATATAAAAVPVRADGVGRERDAASRADLMGELAKRTATMKKQELLKLEEEFLVTEDLSQDRLSRYTSGHVNLLYLGCAYHANPLY